MNGPSTVVLVVDGKSLLQTIVEDAPVSTIKVVKPQRCASPKFDIIQKFRALPSFPRLSFPLMEARQIFR